MTRAPVISNAAGEAHVPVLLEEVVAGLAITQGDTIVDATFGAGGYARALLRAGAGRVIGFDRDPDAIANGPSLVPDSAGGDRLLLIEERFSQMEQALAARDLLPVDGVTMDIGVSSMQLDQSERGFAFSNDGPLDMRMSQSGQTAAEFLNEADEAEIARVIREYGEEPRARKVASAIVAARPLTRTAELAAVVRKALGHHAGMKSDPATRTFQALRIWVNGELDGLDQFVRDAAARLASGGRLSLLELQCNMFQRAHHLPDHLGGDPRIERRGIEPGVPEQHLGGLQSVLLPHLGAAAVGADPVLVLQEARAIDEHPRRVGLHAHVGDHRLHELERRDRAAELLALLGVGDRGVQRPLADAHAARGHRVPARGRGDHR